jgi:hypothetical protein
MTGRHGGREAVPYRLRHRWRYAGRPQLNSSGQLGVIRAQKFITYMFPGLTHALPTLLASSQLTSDTRC